MLTEDEARRMWEIWKANLDKPLDQRLALIEKAIPRAPNLANIRMALKYTDRVGPFGSDREGC